MMPQPGGRYGSGGQREVGYTKAGYQQIQKIYKHDRWWYVWKIFSQLLLILMTGVGAYASYGYYRCWPVYQWCTAFWAMMTIKCICDFMMGRWK